MPVLSVAFSPDGQQVASGNWEGELRIWDAKKGRLLKTILLPKGSRGRITSIDFSPDSKQIVCNCEGVDLRIWDVASGKDLLAIREPVVDVEFSPDGKRIVFCHKNKIETLDLDYDREKEIAKQLKEGRVPERKLASKEASLVKPVPPPVTLRGHQRNVRGIAVSNDGKLIVSVATTIRWCFGM